MSFSVEIMSDQENRPSSGHNATSNSMSESPSAHLLPNPIITKRTRTQSMYFSLN